MDSILEITFNWGQFRALYIYLCCKSACISYWDNVWIHCGGSGLGLCVLTFSILLKVTWLREWGWLEVVLFGILKLGKKSNTFTSVPSHLLWLDLFKLCLLSGLIRLLCVNMWCSCVTLFWTEPVTSLDYNLQKEQHCVESFVLLYVRVSLKSFEVLVIAQQRAASWVCSYRPRLYFIHVPRHRTSISSEFFSFHSAQWAEPSVS